jgi:SAM-dependent methyltransferase
MDWTDGYVSDIAYTTGFYRELAPSFLSFAAALQGQRAPDPAKPFTYCELGCGQGFGTNILAAAYPHGDFVGIDFNPTQIANAQALATEAGLANVSFRDESFQEALAQPEGTWPRFDYIALHGIYAWVSESNRHAIAEFCRRHLKPGGLLYISYNCMPGWAALAPFQRLLREHADRNPARSDRQIEGAMTFVQKLRDAGMAYFSQNPIVPKRIDAFKDKDRTYLAHEYLNGTWQPLFFTDVTRELSAAKLDFIGSASLLENFEGLALPKAAREAMAEVPEGPFREMLKDYAVNQQFRRDIFMKGARPMTAAERRDSLLDIGFRPLQPRADMSFTFKTPLGEANGQPEVYQPVAEAVAEGRVTMREIAERTRIDMAKLGQALAALTANGGVHPAPEGIDPAPAHRFNAAVARMALSGHPYRYAAAPGVGNGIHASDVDIAALEALHRGTQAEAGALAEAVWAQFRTVGRRLVKDGKPIESEDGNLAELTARARTLVEQRLPVWRELGLI